jgi:hypothetical protein
MANSWKMPLFTPNARSGVSIYPALWYKRDCLNHVGTGLHITAIDIKAGESTIKSE